jgi:hypothetical protein
VPAGFVAKCEGKGGQQVCEHRINEDDAILIRIPPTITFAKVE